jgi:hypothetical protein
MTNILPRDRAELIMAEHTAGKSILEIAAEYGHSPQTVRSYALGRRAPGEATARDDDFAPFAAYCRRRLDDDPHLRAIPLQAEITRLGFPGTSRTFYRALERHGIRPHPCPDCRIARINGYALRPADRKPQPSPLAVPLSPVGGETLASFLGRLADANRITVDTLLGILHPWFSIRNQWHDDRWQHEKLASWADEAAACLAAACGSTALALKNALPSFGGNQEQPTRAVTACRLCTAARRIQQPVPAHLPACRQVCLRHGIWLSAHGTPQFSVRDCPDILNAERRARRLLRHCSIEQILYFSMQPPGETDKRSWKCRAITLIESNPRSASESSSQEMLIAAAYPDAIAAAQASSKTIREQSSLAEATLTGHQQQAKRTPCQAESDSTDSSSQVRALS